MKKTVYVIVHETTFLEEESFSEVEGVFSDKDKAIGFLNDLKKQIVDELAEEYEDIKVKSSNQECFDIYYDDQIYRHTVYCSRQILK